MRRRDLSFGGKIKPDQLLLLLVRGGPYSLEDLKSILTIEIDNVIRAGPMDNGSLSGILYSEFTWHETSQGRDFWGQLYWHLRDVEDEFCK